MDEQLRVAVLMSSYNGEKYIEEQIESILKQKDVQVDLYIRDDCSTDSTQKILKRYEAVGKIIYIPGESNLGPGRSFMELLYMIVSRKEYQYFAFADQDDIWLANKLIEGLSIIKKRERNKKLLFPILYGSNQTLFENGKDRGSRYIEKPKINLETCISKNPISGCTYIFNNELAQKIVSSEFPTSDVIEYRLHDAWIMLVALIVGEVIYDERSFILYRIHANNTVGVRKISYKEKFYRLLGKGAGSTKRWAIRSKTAMELLERYEITDVSKLRVLKKYANYKESLKNKLELINDVELVCATGEKTFMFALKVLIGFV